jgi:uncharacterized membrane protein YphA (DoxX/SURF4 family)
MKTFVLRHIPKLAGCLFVYAGLYKLLYPGEATMALESLDAIRRLANPMVIAVTILELYLGTILLLKIDLKYALSLAMGLMFVFAGYLWYLSTLASPPSCGCLGLTGIFNSNKHAALFGLFQNCLILWALKFSYDYHFKARPAAEAPVA